VEVRGEGDGVSYLWDNYSSYSVSFVNLFAPKEKAAHSITTMGAKSSKPHPSFRDKVEEEIARRMMIQREVQMSVSIAKARDTIQIFGSAYATFVSGVALAK
jgi:hypothetical protein